MAANNYFQVVNFAGQAITVVVNGITVSVPGDGTAKALNKLNETGDTVTFNIEVTEGPYTGTLAPTTCAVGSGDNSWTHMVVTTNGYVNLFAGPEGKPRGIHIE